MKKSFTLVEIIIVTSIIAILSTVGAGAYTNFRYRLTFEANFQEMLKFFNNARQFAVTGIKINNASGQSVSPKYFEISSEGSSEIKIEAYVEGSSDPILLDKLTLNSRYMLNFGDIDPNSFPIHIIYSVGVDGAVITSSESDILQNEIKIVLFDTKISNREKTIYINSSSGVAEEV